MIDFEHTEYQWMPEAAIRELDEAGQTVPQLNETWLRVADPVAYFPPELRCVLHVLCKRHRPSILVYGRASAAQTLPCYFFAVKWCIVRI